MWCQCVTYVHTLIHPAAVKADIYIKDAAFIRYMEQLFHAVLEDSSSSDFHLFFVKWLHLPGQEFAVGGKCWLTHLSSCPQYLIHFKANISDARYEDKIYLMYTGDRVLISARMINRMGGRGDNSVCWTLPMLDFVMVSVPAQLYWALLSFKQHLSLRK